MKRFCLLLFFSYIILQAGCHASKQENIDQIRDEIQALVQREEKSIPIQENKLTYVQEEHTAISLENLCPWTVQIQGKEYSAVSPENLCPFTVEVYPEILTVGDPLYIRMNFENNTTAIAWAYAHPFGQMKIDHQIIAFHLKEGTEIISWNTGRVNGMTSHAWQKVKPGEKGLTQYVSLGFPGISYGIGGRSGLSCIGFDKKRWKEIQDLFPSAGNGLGMGMGGIVGQLVVVINNGGIGFVPEDTSMYGIPPKQLRTLMVASPPIQINARDRNEMNAINEILSKRGKTEKDLEYLIQKLTPGTLQNLLKYQLLLLEFKEGFGREGFDDELDVAQIHKVLEKLENFLTPLHEIERENLKLLIENREKFEGRLRNSEILLKKFIEVFGEKPVYVGNVGGM